MNREILFRGKLKNTKEWIEGDLLTDKLTGKMYIFGHDKSFHHYSLNIEKYEVTPETVGQYTGLDDKNGKKIFEGDIIIREASNGSKYIYGIVEFKYGSFYINYDSYCEYNIAEFEYDVVGNINDNKNLLEE